MDLDILSARVQRIIREKPETDRLWVEYQELFEREFANELSRKPLNSLYEVLQSKIMEGENTCRLSVTSLELIDTLAGLHHPNGWPEAGEAATESPWLQVAYRIQDLLTLLAVARDYDVSQPLLYDGVITECDQFIAQKETEMLRKRISYAFIWAKCSNEDMAAVRRYLANGVESVYEGDTEDGRPHGRGKIQYPSGGVYEGEFQKGLYHGQGKLTHPSGDEYDGGWEEGEKHGRGSIKGADGLFYTGDFIHGRREGFAVERLPSGRQYTGEFLDNKWHGEGVLQEPDGTTHSGSWWNGVPSGKGTWKSPEFGIYIGDWLCGKMHGSGEFHFTDGSFFIGSFQNGQEHGYGVCTYPAGACGTVFMYVGKWRDGKPFDGTYTLYDGSVRSTPKPVDPTELEAPTPSAAPEAPAAQASDEAPRTSWPNSSFYAGPLLAASVLPLIVVMLYRRQG